MLSSPRTWGEWFARVPTFAEAAAAVSGWTGRVRKFPFQGGALSIREEQVLPHHKGTCFRARYVDDSAVVFDLRWLEASKDGSSNFVALDDFRAIERELSLMAAARPHPNVVGCHSVMTENQGRLHSRLLLCDPTVDTLAGMLKKRSRTSLSTREIANVGQDLANGLAHLHDHQILCGSVEPASVFLGCDGSWKLGDFRCGVRLPVSVAHWRSQQLWSPRAPPLPPEARDGGTSIGVGDAGIRGGAVADAGCHGVMLTPAADVWMLGRMLAVLLTGCRDGNLLEQRSGGCDTLVALVPDTLCEHQSPRLWLLLHWMLAGEPTQRPAAGAISDVLEGWCSPNELLQMMPAPARFHCKSTVVAAVRQFAAKQVAAETSAALVSMARLCAGISLQNLRATLQDPAEFDAFCENCGVELADSDPLLGDSGGNRAVPELLVAPTSVDGGAGFDSSDAEADVGACPLLLVEGGVNIQKVGLQSEVETGFKCADDFGNTRSVGRLAASKQEDNSTSADTNGSDGTSDSDTIGDGCFPQLVDLTFAMDDAESSFGKDELDVQCERKKDK
eukprot:TRINITY_DN17680_c0_g1_i2.p1 TRINITY_DN17680_c0_g1~~TRINITY_DN17680_c0_g1_i2.p1  ORF type:complete len:561 (-),score=117.08 TRINITY_DN17680_c0_g1_i2:121-1803(-)